MSRENVVDVIGGSNDAATTGGGCASCQPRSNITCFLGVERLQPSVSMVLKSLLEAALRTIAVVEWRWWPILSFELLSATMCTKLVISTALHGRGASSLLTQHVALVILAAALIGDVSLNSEPDHGEIFDAEITGVDPADNAKSSTIVDGLPDILELGTEGGQREVVAGDGITIELESCTSCQQNCEK